MREQVILRAKIPNFQFPNHPLSHCTRLSSWFNELTNDLIHLENISHKILQDA